MDQIQSPRLSPRRRQVLAHILDGKSEKEAAAVLGLSTHTLHAYVKQFYANYGVHSRSELMATFLRQYLPSALRRCGIEQSEQSFRIPAHRTLRYIPSKRSAAR